MNSDTQLSQQHSYHIQWPKRTHFADMNNPEEGYHDYPIDVIKSLIKYESHFDPPSFMTGHFIVQVQCNANSILLKRINGGCMKIQSDTNQSLTYNAEQNQHWEGASSRSQPPEFYSVES